MMIVRDQIICKIVKYAVTVNDKFYWKKMLNKLHYFFIELNY